MAAARACSGSAIAAQTPPHGPVWAAPRVVSASVRARVQSNSLTRGGFEVDAAETALL